MSNIPTDDWLTKIQAAAALGVSEQTVYRMADRGEIQKATRHRPGAPPMVVFHPGDIAREKAKRDGAPRPFVMPPGTDVETASDVSKEVAVRPAFDVSKLLQLAAPRRDGPLYLTLEQAIQDTGLGATYLRHAVPWRPIGPRGALVCRRADLDAL